MSRLSNFSEQNAPILTGKQTVRFAPECLQYVKDHGSFPEAVDARGEDYLHIQFIFSNGAKTASWKEDQQEKNPKFQDNLKLYFDGKYHGDGFKMRLTYEELKKRDKRYKSMTLEEIFGDLIDNGEFTVWLYRYESKGRGYLQVAWNQEQYRRATQKKPETKAKLTAVEEDEIPFDLED